MKPRSCVVKLPSVGNTESIAGPSGTPNQRASVAPYWSSEVLGINASTLYRKLIAYGVERPGGERNGEDDIMDSPANAA